MLSAADTLKLFMIKGMLMFRRYSQNTRLTHNSLHMRLSEYLANSCVTFIINPFGMSAAGTYLDMMLDAHRFYTVVERALKNCT